MSIKPMLIDLPRPMARSDMNRHLGRIAWAVMRTIRHFGNRRIGDGF